MATCKQCGSDKNPDDANFCGQCGTQLDPDASTAAAVEQALEDLKVERKIRHNPHNPMARGTPYIEDVNSRRIFGRLRRAAGLRAIPHLVAYLKHQDFLTRWKAMRLLVYFRYADAEVLRDSWQKEHENLVRIMVPESLANATDESAFQLLVDISAEDDEPQIRQKASRLLRNFARSSLRPRVVSALLDAVHDNVSEIRRLAMSQLIDLKAAEVLDDAREIIADQTETGEIFVLAARAIAEMGDVACIAGIFRRLPQAVGGPSSYQLDQFRRGVLSTCVRRFGLEPLLAQIAEIPDEKTRETVEKALRRPDGR